jgi:hypothetical protein
MRGQEDLAHAPFSQATDDPIVPDGLADHREATNRDMDHKYTGVGHVRSPARPDRVATMARF